MTIELSILLSGAAVIFTIFQGIVLMQRNKKIDLNNDSTQLTTVIVKLENISTGISEIKNEMNNLKIDVKEDKERIVLLEANYKYLHERQSICERQCKRLFPFEEKQNE